ncbi:MAG: 3'-5' exonuclease [Myxococcota bacterium]
MTHPIVGEELELLERVLRALAERPPFAGPSEEPIVRDLERIRELLVSGQESKDRTLLLDQWQQGTALLAQLRRSRSAPRVERSSPYFAHLRLREGDRERDLCLGKATCTEGGVRVVDWRNAPVSRVFYRYQQGEFYEEEFGGRRVEGEVRARRSVTIRAGTLHRVDAPEGTFERRGPDAADWSHREQGPRLQGGEGVAIRAHRMGNGSERRLGTDPSGAKHRADKRLPEIAGLLDPTQFELISRVAPGLLVVRGSAGSGKTTVTLHRIAYLAYEDRRIDAPRTLFLTFSPALRDYVRHVLPALGVTRVQLSTFEEWAAAQRSRVLPRLPRTHRDDTPAAVRRAKLHPALADALEAHVRRSPGPRRWEQVVDDWASALTDPDLLARCFARFEAGMGPGALAELHDWSRRRVDEVWGWLEGDREAGVGLDPEDDALLLRAWQLRVGPLLADRRPLAYRHLAIDEVQDFSPIELRVVLETAAEPRSVTLAGDTQQQIALDTGFRSWDALFDSLGLEEVQTTTLRISYRSSPEIMRFALEVLGPLREDEEPAHAARTGPPVELFEFTDHGACVAHVADALQRLSSEEPLASVAVLTPSAAMSRLYHEGLQHSEVPRVRRVVDHGFSFAPGIEVAEVEQAKGLEFDYVVLVDVSRASYPAEPRFRRLLHVGATRAIHQLWVMSAGEPSPLVSEPRRAL